MKRPTARRRLLRATKALDRQTSHLSGQIQEMNLAFVLAVGVVVVSVVVFEVVAQPPSAVAFDFLNEHSDPQDASVTRHCPNQARRAERSGAQWRKPWVNDPSINCFRAPKGRHSFENVSRIIINPGLLHKKQKFILKILFLVVLRLSRNVLRSRCNLRGAHATSAITTLPDKIPIRFPHPARRIGLECSNDVRQFLVAGTSTSI